MAEQTGTPMNVRLLEAAFSLAAHVHVVHVRKASKVPYMAHLLGVAELVWTSGGSDVEAAAALLHDAVEDGGGKDVAA